MNESDWPRVGDLNGPDSLDGERVREDGGETLQQIQPTSEQVAMKQVYTHANRMLVLNVQNILEQAGIKTLLRNEFAVGGMGELSPFDAWLEVWVVDSADLNKAKKLAGSVVSHPGAAQWICDNCQESNDPSFEYCWNCQNDAGTADGQVTG